jgi:hypothetical protein
MMLGRQLVIRHLRQSTTEMPAVSRVTRHQPPIPPWSNFLRSTADPGLCNPPSPRTSIVLKTKPVWWFDQKKPEPKLSSVF